MKKTNLIILLVFPFLISLFCIITVNTTYNRVDVDISYIDWDYNDMEGFRISETGYPLRAVGVNQRFYAVTEGNALVWKVENKNGNDTEPCAEIYQSNGAYYLKALREGEVVITCSNQKGNVHRQMTGVIYETAAILFYPTIGSSQTNIDQTIYYGEYDHTKGEAAKIDMTMYIVPASDLSDLVVENSPNVEFDVENQVITFIEPGASYVTLSLKSQKITPVTFSFEVVDEGVNVYTYEDLLHCTNLSKTGGDIVVLRKSFESLQNAYITDSNGIPILSGGILQKKANNVECFGNYDPHTRSFSFDEEVDSIVTTYNRSFIDQWNEFVKTNSNYSTITDKVLVGLHVQKDFYGNGYTVNMHNLTYPYSSVPMTTESGEIVRIPQLTSENLFRGPLKMYTLGDPNNVPLVSLYGQDNIGMYVDGNNITVNDVNVKNCDFGDRLANLATVGTVLEVHGNGVTVKNSRISCGKNVVRSFSSMDLKLINCMLSHSQNFLFVTGSNEYEKVDTKAMGSFYALDGTQQTEILEAFIAPKEGKGDEILNTFMTKFCKTEAERNNMGRALRAIQTAINTAQNLEGNFKGSTEIEDCFFYSSGISAICMESLFNSPFLETASPSQITDIFAIVNGLGKSLVPYTATSVSGISYPVKLNIGGDTRFYDYKVANEIDLSGLIEENISAIASSILGSATQIDIDTIFPLRSMLVQRAGAVGAVRHSDGKSYVNIPVAFYGGGLNLSQVTITGYENKSSFSGAIDVDLLDSYLRLSGSSSSDTLRGLILKTVITVTGFEPFSFHFTTGGAYFGETPQITDLIANSKGT